MEHLDFIPERLNAGRRREVRRVGTLLPMNELDRDFSRRLTPGSLARSAEPDGTPVTKANLAVENESFREGFVRERKDGWPSSDNGGRGRLDSDAMGWRLVMGARAGGGRAAFGWRRRASDLAGADDY